MNRSTRWRCSHRPYADGRSLVRSEENAIHCPSGDHEGRKSPPGPEVSGFARRVCTSIVHRSAVPPARVLTNTICLASGEYELSWSSGDDVFEMPLRCAAGEVTRVRAEPAAARRR